MSTDPEPDLTEARDWRGKKYWGPCGGEAATGRVYRWVQLVDAQKEKL